MGIVVPLAKVPNEEFTRKVKAVKEYALAKAKEKYLKDVKELVIRTLGPRDLGLNADEWTFSVSAGTNTDVVNTKLDDKTMIVIYGIYNLSTSPQVNEVIFKTGSETIEDVYIEDMYMYDIPAVLLDKLLLYTPGSIVKIDFVAKGSNTAEKLGFLGFVIEPAGKRISR